METDSKRRISSEKIDGICYVQHLTDPKEIESWVEHNDHFYVNQKRDGGEPLVGMRAKEWRMCTSCYDDRVEKLQREQDLKSKNEPLRGLELFSGTFKTSKPYTFCSPFACTRRWWSRNGHGYVRFCRDKVRCRVLPVGSYYFPVRATIFPPNPTNLREFAGPTILRQRSIARIRASFSNMPSKPVKARTRSASCPSTGVDFVNPCLPRGQLTSCKAVCEYLLNIFRSF